MKILFLGSEDCELIAWLHQYGDTVQTYSDKITPQVLSKCSFDLLISYGYRYILSPETLAHFPNSAINLHISLLPWNRGADPNLWSFVENTPKGVTIHHIDEGLDTGDIIAQTELNFVNPQETLSSSYAKLHNAIQSLFKVHWHDIRSRTAPRKAQALGGSSHRSRDKQPLERMLLKSWDTPVSELENLKRST
ncbi:MAG: formyl transferase [Alteromonadaceae bacterium]|nr:MAG: formyl transferase [Alteromonadaceae bacterium]